MPGRGRELGDTLLCVSPAAVTHHSLGRVEFNVVHSATGRMDPASSKALFNDLKGHVEVYHCVYLVNSIQGFCLWKCPWKT